MRTGQEDAAAIEAIGKENMLAFYKQHLAGKIVTNQHTGITVEFTTSVGGRKVAHGGALYTAKVEGMRLAADLLEVAEYLNFGPAKSTDAPNVLGYLNFKAKGLVNERAYVYKLNVLLRNDGKFFYNLDTPKPKK